MLGGCVFTPYKFFDWNILEVLDSRRLADCTICMLEKRHENECSQFSGTTIDARDLAHLESVFERTIADAPLSNTPDEANAPR